MRIVLWTDASGAHNAKCQRREGGGLLYSEPGHLVPTQDCSGTLVNPLQ